MIISALAFAVILAGLAFFYFSFGIGGLALFALAMLLLR